MRFVTEAPKSDPVNVVTLEQNEDGVSVKIAGYFVFDINNSGAVIRHSGISSKDTGLQVDRAGYAKIKKGS